MSLFRVALRSVAVVATLLQSAAAGPSGTNTVRIEAEDAYLEKFNAAYWVIQGPKIEVPFALGTPAPAPGLTVGTVSSLNPGLGSVFFVEGEASASTFESFSSDPFQPFTTGWEARTGYLAITTLPEGTTATDPSLLWIAQVRESGASPGGTACYACWIWEYLCFIFQGHECSICSGGSASADAARSGLRGLGDLDVLRRYRDEVLAPTPQGQFYTDLYATLSVDLILATVATPSLPARVYRTQAQWVPALQALVDGVGDGATVTPSMQDDLLSILASLEAGGSPTLASTVAFERSRLDLGHIAGLSMTEFQQQVETLGGTSAIEPQAWGKVKAMYR